MTAVLVDQLKTAAGTRSDHDAMLMREAAGEIDRQRLQISSLLRAADLLSEDVLQRCDKIYAAIERHLGPAP